MILEGLRTRQNVSILPKESDWAKTIEWALANKIEPSQFLECYDLLREQPWRTSPVKPDHVQYNLPNLENLRNPGARQKVSQGRPSRPERRKRAADKYRAEADAIMEADHAGH
jgi:hypothetical protein